MAASATAARRIGRKKEGFKEFLQRVSSTDKDVPGSELFILNQRSKELDQLARGFRHHALHTQKRQDAHLSLYRQWVSTVLTESQTNGELGDDDLDRLCFPDPSSDSSQPWARLQSQLRCFLVFALEKCIPRSASDDSISYQVLVQCRHSMIFWVLRKYRERSIEPPKSRWLETTMSEMTSYLQDRVKIRTHRTSAVNTRVGTWEILQMMEFDLRETPCIELAECHHLAWVLARLAALRPGSLGRPDRVGHLHLPFLVWGNVQIERTTTVGVFYVQMTIRNLKGKTNNPETGHKYSPLYCKTAFELSAPHRLLTIALRRGVLVGIETLDDLFTQPQRYILIKDEFKDQPILLAGGSRGLTVENKPMTSLALTEYLSLRGKKIGLLKSISFYSIRRNTAMDLSTKLGSDMARAIMAHDPDSTMMETYYTADRTAIPDLTSVALDTMPGTTNNQPIDGSLAFSRLNNDQIRKFGPLLNSMFHKLREIDDDYPHDRDKQTQKNRDRVLHRAALRATMQECYKEQRKSVTVDATKLNVDKLQSICNKFNHRVLNAAKQLISDKHSSTVVDGRPAAGNDPSGIDLTANFVEDDLDTPE
ncbi:hypothetical protein DER45DRAFT_649192 [Fusarium avenaceum]|nr:hypothetical protein DER45DRAFT_649192 [Fusarium avenaceum]